MGESAPGVSNLFPLHGDEWRIEAQVLKWKPWANVLGLDTQYRLDRLSGRYESTQDELTAPRSAYDLGPEPGNVDLWKIARKSKRYAPMVDSLYGGGAFMPMADGACGVTPFFTQDAQATVWAGLPVADPAIRSSSHVLTS
jgi:hypothetical protein